MRFIKYMNIVPVAENYYFLVNGLNGAIDTIDKEGYLICEKWRQQCDIKPTPEELDAFNYLKNRGYLCEGMEDEESRNELIKKLEYHRQLNSNMINLTFIVTYDCNFSCTYCYEKPNLYQSKEQIHKRMNSVMVKAIYEYIDREELKINDSVIYGGEPLLLENEEVVFTILEEAKKRNNHVILVTNGFYLAHYAERLAKYQFKYIQVTLDGSEELHNKFRKTKEGRDTFNQIIQGIKDANAHGLPILIRHNVDFDNTGYDERLDDYLKETGLLEHDNIKLTVGPIINMTNEYHCPDKILYDYLKNRNDFNNIPEPLHKLLSGTSSLGDFFYGKQVWKPKYIFCSASSITRIIDPLGNIYPCQSLVGIKEQAIGHFNGTRIIYNSNFDDWQNRTVDNIEKCHSCWAIFICGGGCGMDSLHVNGDFKEPICISTDNLLQMYLPFLFHKFVLPTL